tara:strand:+ start:616 stop:978 length:363 start_codon:yes stop_codon:yes gene_type:complete
MIKTSLLISSLTVFVVSNTYFGWNMSPQSDAERVCDFIWLALFISYFMYKEVQKEWHYHVSFAINNNGINGFGHMTVERKLPVSSEDLKSFRDFVATEAIINDDNLDGGVTILSFQEVTK